MQIKTPLPGRLVSLPEVVYTVELQPQTEAWTPSVFLLEDHGPELAPQPIPMGFSAPALVGLEVADVDRSLALLLFFSYPYPRGDEVGGEVRLL